MTNKAVAPSAGSSEDGELLRCGAEIVEFSERFYRGMFLGITFFVGAAALAALILLPLRAGPGGLPVTGIMGAGLLILAASVTIRRAGALYRVLRKHPKLELGLVLYAAALVAAVFPLKSQLWWPSCALLMLLAVVAPMKRVLAYCLIVLMANLVAHLLSGDLGRTPAVAVIGLWIGYIFWSSTVAVISAQLAAYLLRLNAHPDVVQRTAPRRINAWLADQPKANNNSVDEAMPGSVHLKNDPPMDGEPGADSEVQSAVVDDVSTTWNGMDRLTARQLQVVALLADGLLYREVAACLSISEGQVQRHVALAVRRLGVRSATELVAVAVAERIVPSPRTADSVVLGVGADGSVGGLGRKSMNVREGEDSRPRSP